MKMNKFILSNRLTHVAQADPMTNYPPISAWHVVGDPRQVLDFDLCQRERIEGGPF